jgi:hypothetical protein
MKTLSFSPALASAMSYLREPNIARAHALRRAAEQGDELAAFHCPVSPVLPTERIAHLSYGRRLLRCGISIRSMSVQGQSRRIDMLPAVAACPLRSESAAGDEEALEVDCGQPVLLRQRDDQIAMND